MILSDDVIAHDDVVTLDICLYITFLTQEELNIFSVNFILLEATFY
jgi:hypothetical protein